MMIGKFPPTTIESTYTQAWESSILKDSQTDTDTDTDRDTDT